MLELSIIIIKDIVIINCASFKWSLICICNLLFLNIDIIIAEVFAKYSHLEILRIESIIISRLVMLEKYKDKINSKYFK